MTDFATPSQPNHYDLALKAQVDAAIGPWLARQMFVSAAFDALYAALAEKSEQLTTESTVSKQILLSFVQAINVLEIQQDPRADQFKRLMELIANNDAASDRQPGVPRIF
ncbi:hypothetical protein [Shewanella sp.]|uniref:hypothetical protein n=1 Tax=Shewanella sp. TaxID=50422 RepID=UPI003A9695F2